MPEPADSRPPAEETTPTASTAGSSTTTKSAVEPPTTTASPTETETPEEPSPDEPPTTDPPTEDLPIASADKPSAADDPADLQPQDNEAESEPEATLTQEPVPETPLTWQGIPVITVDEASTTETEGAVRAPRLLSGFDDVEVLLHDRDRAWTFGPDGAVLHEWSFEDLVLHERLSEGATPTVFPDGAGGIVFTNGPEIFHQAAPEANPELVVGCTDSCDWTRLIGVAVLDGSTEVIYTVRTNHTHAGWEGNPDIREILHRMSLDTRETVSLTTVGGYEWWFGNTSISGHELFGAYGSDGDQGWTGIDLNSGNNVAKCSAYDVDESEEYRECPTIVSAFKNDMAVVEVGISDQPVSEFSGATLRVLALRSRKADDNTYSLPLRMPRGVCMRNLEIWQSVSVINTGAFNDTGSSCNQTYHSVLADFSTGEIELYSHPGSLRLVPRTEADPEAESATPETWQGMPVITVAESAAQEPERTVTGPRLLRRFYDVEVLLHDRNRAWTFGSDHSVATEWSFKEAVWSVFPDGASGIVYQVESEILHQTDPETDPEVLVECVSPCLQTIIGKPVSMVGVATLGASTEVIYTAQTCDQVPEGYSGNPPCHERLQRTSLNTRETTSLGVVGGWEWWFYNTVVADNELFGAWGTDGGNGVVGYDLLDGSSTYGGFETADPDCFDTGPSLDCPRFAFALNDSIVTAFMESTFVVSSHERDSEQHQYTLPIGMPPEVNGIYGIEAWDSVLVINTVTREEAPDSSQPRWLPYRAVLIDLDTHETEIYSHPGVLRLVHRTAAG